MWLDSNSPRRHGILNDNLNVRHGILPTNCDQRDIRGPQTTQAIAIALGCLLELDDKTLLLKTYTLVFRNGKKSTETD